MAKDNEQRRDEKGIVRQNFRAWEIVQGVRHLLTSLLSPEPFEGVPEHITLSTPKRVKISHLTELEGPEKNFAGASGRWVVVSVLCL